MKKEKIVLSVVPLAYVESLHYRDLLLRKVDLENGLKEYEEQENEEMAGGYRQFLHVLGKQIEFIELFWSTDKGPAGYYFLARFLEDGLFTILEEHEENFSDTPSVDHVNDDEAFIRIRKGEYDEQWFCHIKHELEAYLFRAKGKGWQLLFEKPEVSRTRPGYLLINVKIRKKEDADKNQKFMGR